MILFLGDGVGTVRLVLRMPAMRVVLRFPAAATAMLGMLMMRRTSRARSSIMVPLIRDLMRRVGLVLRSRAMGVVLRAVAAAVGASRRAAWGCFRRPMAMPRGSHRGVIIVPASDAFVDVAVRTARMRTGPPPMRLGSGTSTRSARSPARRRRVQGMGNINTGTFFGCRNIIILAVAVTGSRRMGRGGSVLKSRFPPVMISLRRFRCSVMLSPARARGMDGRFRGKRWLKFSPAFSRRSSGSGGCFWRGVVVVLTVVARAFLVMLVVASCSWGSVIVVLAVVARAFFAVLVVVASVSAIASWCSAVSFV